MDNQRILEFKTAFAKSLLEIPDNPMKAALAVIPDTGIACQAAFEWLNDEFVKSEQIRLLNDLGHKHFLTSKEQQLRDIYKIASDATVDHDVRLKAHRLYAEIASYIDKPSANNIQNNIINSAVMVVKDHGDDTNWEQRALEQQRKLIHGDAIAAN